jgi:drug/metabolite transporter (DMT)-like permease
MKTFYIIVSLFAIILWGIALLATRVLIENNFPLNFITISRFGIASIFLRLSLKKKHIKKIENTDRIYFLLMAAGGISLFYFFENSGVKFTTISNTSLIIATIPLFTLLYARIIHKKKLSWQNALGLPIGLIGTVILFLKDFRADNALHLKGDILVLGCVVFWIVYSFAFRKIMHKYNTIFITYIITLWGTLF